MGKRLVFYLRIASGLGAVFGFSWSVMSWVWGNGMKILNALGPPEYAGLIAFFLGLLIVSIFPIVNSWRPGFRFQSLKPEMEEILETIELVEVIDSKDVQVTSLRRKLQRLRVDLPPYNLERSLPLLIALSNGGEIREARSVNWERCRYRSLALTDIPSTKRRWLKGRGRQ